MEENTYSGAMAALMALMFSAACQTNHSAGTDGSGPLPRLTGKDISNPGYIPPNAYKQYVPGLLVRSIYETDSTINVDVEIMDLLVGPGMSTEIITMPGASVLEVRSGHGVVIQGNSKTEFNSGYTFSIANGRPFRLINMNEELSIAIRATVIREKAR